MRTFKRHRDYGFFDQDLKLSKLTKLGDPLEKLSQGIDFEMFRNILETGLEKVVKGKGGRRPFDYVMMFKILILQRYYNLSDDQVEFQINDRMSFMRFLNLTISDDIPDSKTVWNFRQQIVDMQLIDSIFDLFLGELERLNLVVNEGKIIDASFIEVPKQRNTKAENNEIKNGETPESFDENLNKKRQKDTDARWTQKNNVNYFGYKNHIKIDAKSKLITKFTVTPANVHDSQETVNLINKKDQGEDLHADSAYTGAKQEAIIAENKMTSKVHEKGYRANPLSKEQQESNKEKSSIRARVEHVFGFMENSMNSMRIQCIGLTRTYTTVALMNLTYNMFRKIQLQTI